jgi:pimeloyl-ACP methyl ester carboxylesterase
MNNHAAVFIGVIFFLIAGCSSNNNLQFINVFDTTIHTRVIGKNHPIIIFEAGMGSTMDTWQNIPDSIAKTNRVFLYDRAGLGNSDLTKRERTIPNMVEELRMTLQARRMEPPYVYVAHSMGSYIARYFANQYPEEIAGVILIDPSPDKMYDDYSEEEYENFQLIGDDSFANSSEGAKNEWENYLDNRKYVTGKIPPDEIPMIILSATEWDFYAYHQEMMNNNPNSKHLKIEGSHGLHQEKPELIIRLIREIVLISEN